MVLNQGDRIEIKIDDIAFGGDRVGHYKGLAVFVDSGIPGEKVKVEITTRKKNYARAKLLQVLNKSYHRQEPPCSVYNQCGGCQLQEIEYSKQLKYKWKMVKDTLKRIGNIDTKINQVISSDYPWYYRNKAQFPLTETGEGEIRAGFFKQGSHQVIVNERCSIQHQLINRIAEYSLEILNKYDDFTVYDEEKHMGLLRHLVIRVGVCTNQAILIIVTSRKKFPHIKEISQKLMAEVPELKGIVHNINRKQTNVILGDEYKVIAGKSDYIDYVDTVKFNISPSSFFQTNTLQTKKMYIKVKEFANLKGDELVVDCYCGIGSIGLFLANSAEKIIGFEHNGQAVKKARENAKFNNIDNAQFLAKDVTKGLDYLENNNYNPELVIFDPPRKGLKQEVVNKVLSLAPQKIIYVSCNPSTLARDLKLFKEKYSIELVQPIDMFPQTYHIETITLLERKYY